MLTEICGGVEGNEAHHTSNSSDGRKEKYNQKFNSSNTEKDEGIILKQISTDIESMAVNWRKLTQNHIQCLNLVLATLKFCVLIRKMRWLRRLIAGISPTRPGFNPRPVHVRFVVDELTLRQVFLPVLWFSPVSIIPPVLHTHSLIYHCCYTISATDSAVKQHT
jgi:hypothetical protein